MHKSRRVLFFLVCAALLANLPRTAAAAEAGPVQKATQQVDKAITTGVRELGKGFKKASQAVDRAAKAGSNAKKQVGSGKE